MKQILQLLIIFLSGPAFAQYDPGATMMIAQNNLMYNNTIQSFVNQNIMNDIAYGKAGSRTKKAGTKAKSSVNNAAFLFGPSVTTSQTVQQDIINTIKQKNHQVGNSLEKAFKLDKPFPRYVTYLKSLGLDVQHNYADAFAAYILGMWRIANKAADPGADKIQAVREQVTLTLDVAGWSNEQKQEAAEYMIYDLILANESYNSAKKEGMIKEARAYSDMVHNRFLRKNQLDLRSMTLSKNGLTKKL
ncbi:hypothetical protein D7322_03640 [Sphingobacterium puteale]|uniref:TerB family tellurite resistance protein n=1 Tax=Sphingobacterium puteale TaxID=2420510 RepID=A0A420W3C2_9SPHI|nr:hypothetical protein [Sphingobacterium puteale]RKO73099.1 hypothetical protein D7322_03640 [Sphingobacterium puteale]